MLQCEVTDYIATLRVTEIRYVIGGPALVQVGPYTFDEIPGCGYPETVTLTDLPVFMTHNEASSDFTVPQSDDLNLIGEYTVNIRSEIQVPDDPTQSTFTTYDAAYDFLVIVDPCSVTSLIDIETVGDITYRIGDPDQTQGTYSF